MQQLETVYSLFGVPYSLGAQQNENCQICEKVLIQDRLEYKFDANSAKHYLNTIDESNYQKKDTKWALSAGLDIMGLPVGAGIDYKAFDEYRRRLFHQSEFKYTAAESTKFLKEAFSSETLKAFNECVNAVCKTDAIGLFAYLHSIDDDDVSIAYKYKPLIGNSRDRIEIEGFDIGDNLIFLSATDSRRFTSNHIPVKPNDHKIIRFKRKDPHKYSKVNIDFSINGIIESKEIKITALPVIKEFVLRTFIHTYNPADHGYSITHANVFKGYALSVNGVQAGSVMIPMPGKHDIVFGPWENKPGAAHGNGWNITNIAEGQCGLGRVEIWVDKEEDEKIQGSKIRQ